MRIVLAEDDEVVRTQIQKTLECWGHEVLPAVDGEEAWELLSRHEAPVLITNWVMPKMDGMRLCEKVRTSSLPRYTYIIMLTAAHAKGDIVKGLEAGADDYLITPCDQSELRVRIRCGERIIELEEALTVRIQELEDSVTHVTKLCVACRSLIASPEEREGTLAGFPGAWHSLGSPLKGRF
jgi:DNA-binding response OmpR family regulator